MTTLADRITVDQDQCGGRPCVRGLRIRVTDVLDLLASGLTPEAVVEELPDLGSRTCRPASGSPADVWPIRSSRRDVTIWLDNQLPPALTNATPTTAAGMPFSRLLQCRRARHSGVRCWRER